MTPQRAISKLHAKGLNDRQIAELCTKKGVSTTQATLHRLHSGKHRTCRHDLGALLIKLAKKP